jgi:aquaporin Z
MISAWTFGTLLGHPDSPVVGLFRNPTMLRILMGVAMGSTSAALVYSKLGKRSGAHMNPSTTLTFWRLGKIDPIDAVLYVAAQFTVRRYTTYVESQRARVADREAESATANEREWTPV